MSHIAEKIRRGTFSCFTTFGYRKKWESEGEEVTRFCVESSGSHSAEKTQRGESFSVSFILGFEKVWINVGRVSRFSVENYLSHSAEIFRRVPFSVSVLSGTEKI